MRVDLVNRSRPKLYITDNYKRSMTKGNIPSYILLGIVTSSFNLSNSSCEIWLKYS